MSENGKTSEIRSRVPIDDVSFSVTARVAMQLGRESISNSTVAILELVKNAYDADAETVKIRFGNLDKTNPLLVIEDDGNGMNEQQLRDGWLVIGTSNKLLLGQSSRKKRVLTGEKGLGRLGLDRLCEKTVVQSFSEGESSGLELEINWRKYEEIAAPLEKIRHDLYRIPKFISDPITNLSKEFSEGTRLILYDLKDVWSKEHWQDLKQELRLLISPFAGINDFAIELDSGMKWDEIDGKVGSAEMLNAAEWRLIAEFDEEKNVSYIMSSDQHQENFKHGPFSWSENFRHTNEQPLCGPLKFEMYFFPRRPVDLGEVNFSYTQIREFLDSNQGIRIYRDGFRVKPYGEPTGEGDWLRLSYRRQQHPSGITQGNWRVGSNQVVGAVFLERDKNPDLIDQTNREGIVEGPAFNHLKMLAGNAIRFFELCREEFEKTRDRSTEYEKARREATKSTKASLEAVKNLKNTTSKVTDILQTVAPETPAVHDVEALLKSLDSVINEVDETVVDNQKAYDQFAKATEEQQEALQSQKDTLGNLASLGILTTSFGHEALGDTNVVTTNARQLQRNLDKGLFMVGSDVRKMVEDNLEFLVYSASKINNFAKFTLKNVSRDKRKRKKVDLSRIIRQILGFFAESLQQKNITVELNLPKKVSPILAFEIDWESIFVNLITNAVWALEDTWAEKRKIRISMREVEDHLEITFADSGCGLEAETEDKIFLPTFSTKRNKKGEIIGTGLGLAIVKGFVEDYKGGSINVQSPCDLGGAQFYIQIPIPNLNNRSQPTQSQQKNKKTEK